MLDSQDPKLGDRISAEQHQEEKPFFSLKHILCGIFVSLIFWAAIWIARL